MSTDAVSVSRRSSQILWRVRGTRRSSATRRRAQAREAKGESHVQQEGHDQRTAIQRGDCKPPAAARADAAEDAVRYQVVECGHGERCEKDQANARVA